MIISYNNLYITSCIDHITSHHALQKQVRRPLLCLLQVLRGCYGVLAKTILTYGTKTTTVIYQVCCFNLQQGPAAVKFDSTKVGETDTR